MINLCTLMVKLSNVIIILAANLHNDLTFVTRRDNCELCKTSKAFTKGAMVRSGNRMKGQIFCPRTEYLSKDRFSYLSNDRHMLIQMVLSCK